jgi:hypothetical protein
LVSALSPLKVSAYVVPFVSLWADSHIISKPGVLGVSGVHCLHPLRFVGKEGNNMNRREQEQSTFIILTVLTLSIILALVFGILGQAEGQTAGYKLSCYFTMSEVLPGGDVEGHTHALYEVKGLGYLENGEAMIYSGWTTVEITKDSAQGYALDTWIDGSTTVSRARFNVTKSSEGKVSLDEGTFEFIKGTGRFAGIKGKASFTGKPLIPFRENEREDCFYKGVTLYTVPSK